MALAVLVRVPRLRDVRRKTFSFDKTPALRSACPARGPRAPPPSSGDEN